VWNPTARNEIPGIPTAHDEDHEEREEEVREVQLAWGGTVITLQSVQWKEWLMGLPWKVFSG
jgi:hypothetical protein